MNKNFAKPALNNTALIKLLQQRGLIIANPLEAAAKLETVGYYRLSAYFKPFYKLNQKRHQFKEGVDFEQIWNIYNFDSELRSLVYIGLEKIEIAFRTAISDHMSIKYHPAWYHNKGYFRNPDYHAQFMRQVELICRSQEEPFIRHYYTKYNNPDYPPSWMVLQCLTFGACGNVVRNLKNFADAKEIYKIFKYHPTIIESWLDTLRYTRNVCAHHARLWNRWFIIQPMQPKDWLIKSPPNSFHEQLVVILSLLATLNQKEAWQAKLYTLFTNYPDIPYNMMGFSREWALDPIWQLPN